VSRKGSHLRLDPDRLRQSGPPATVSNNTFNAFCRFCETIVRSSPERSRSPRLSIAGNFRIPERRAASLSRSDVGKIIGGDVRQLNIRATDPLFDEVGLLDARLRASEGRSFFTYWEIHRNYTAEELESASL